MQDISIRICWDMSYRDGTDWNRATGHSLCIRPLRCKVNSPVLLFSFLLNSSSDEVGSPFSQDSIFPHRT